MFLKRTAEHLLSHHADDLTAVTVVLPSRRACVYFKYHLASIISQPVILPRICTIEDLVNDIADVSIISTIELTLQFFKIYREQHPDELFEEFIGWGQTVLADFNDIDLNLVNAEELFSYINETKALKVWNLEKRALTDHEIKYLNFFKSFSTYYTLLKDQVSADKKAWQGLAYRNAYEVLVEKKYTAATANYLFAGFNALLLAEEKIMDLLKQQFSVQMLWDIDAYYFDDEAQEAGSFLRKHCGSLNRNAVSWIEENFKKDKQIEIVGVNGQTAQTKIAGRILSDIGNNNLLNTAVVLADETLLLPMLYALPADIKSFNVTMGLDVKHLPAYDLMHTLFMMHENAVRMCDMNKQTRYSFYHKDMRKLLEHPYFTRLLDSFIAGEIQLPEGKVFYSQQDILQLIASPDQRLKELFQQLFSNWHNEPQACITAIDALLNMLLDTFEQEKKSGHASIADIEYCKLFSGLNAQFGLLVADKSIVTGILSLHIIFEQFVKGIQIPFVGEPLEGLQIMGMLETRTLDFDTLILIGANEGVLPKQRSNNTFIPFDLRVRFGMPTYHDRDAIFAYHFYKLIQRAKHVYILYNSLVGDFGSGEPSRFITQLQHELPLYNPSISIKHSLVQIPLDTEKKELSIVIEKNDEVMQALFKKAASGLSPTSLNAYISCGLKFYLRELAGIKEPDEKEDDIDPRSMGNAIHEVLEDLYRPFLGQPLTTEHIDQMLNEYKKLLLAKYQADYSEEELSFGTNLLTVHISDKFIHRFFESEKKAINELKEKGQTLVVEKLESHLFTTIKLEGIEEEIKLKGTVDRIDRVAGLTRIIDYKTGKVDAKQLAIKDWSLLITEVGTDKAFQLFLYAWLYESNYPDANRKMTAANYSFRDSKGELLKVSTPEKHTELTSDILKKFEEQLLQLLHQLFNKQLPFTQATDNEACKYCPYLTICRK